MHTDHALILSSLPNRKSSDQQQDLGMYFKIKLRAEWCRTVHIFDAGLYTPSLSLSLIQSADSRESLRNRAGGNYENNLPEKKCLRTSSHPVEGLWANSVSKLLRLYII
jgi:hypothetical protein